MVTLDVLANFILLLFNLVAIRGLKRSQACLLVPVFFQNQMFLSELRPDCHLSICFPCQEGANQLLHQQCLPIFASHQLVINIATRYFVFYLEKQFPTQACLGRAGCPSGGYFHIVSSLTFHNLLTRGPLKLIKSQTFGFISDNLFGQPAWRKGGKELGSTIYDISNNK